MKLKINNVKLEKREEKQKHEKSKKFWESIEVASTSTRVKIIDLKQASEIRDKLNSTESN